MAVIPIESSESKEMQETTVGVALVSHDCRTRVGQPGTLAAPAQNECTQHSSAVQDFRTESSMGTGGDLSAVPVAHAECVPCKAEERREASRAVRHFFRIV